MMASRSSTTASVSRNVRSPLGRCELITARTATAKAMSVAVGIAQPRAVPLACVDRDEQDRRQDHAAHRGGHRERRSPGVAQVAGHELALELQPGHEEEDRQQPVGRPARPGSGRGAARRARPCRSRRSKYAGDHGELAQTSRDRRADHEQQTADASRRAAPPRPASSRGTTPARTGDACAAGRSAWHGCSGVGWTDCRPDFPAHRRRAYRRPSTRRRPWPWTTWCARC